MGGPDEGYSWIIATACFLYSLVLAGIFRTSGVLFVAFIHSFGATREEASWPNVISISVLNLTGPFSGMLGQKFGARPVIMTGAILATIGISSCYFATSLDAITFLFGGIFGIGWGFMSTLIPGVLNAYFLELRATANGIAYSGGCFGSFLLPIAFEYFIEVFDLSGCFLLTGGIVLQSAVLGALMKPPPWLPWISQSPKNSHNLFVKNETELTTKERVNKEFKNFELVSNENETSANKGGLLEQSSTSGKRFNIQERDIKSKQNYSVSHFETVDNAGKPLLINASLKGKFKNENPSVKDIVHNFITVLTCPMFHVTALTNVSFYFIYHMYLVTIIDFALDRNVPPQNAKDMLFAFSIADFFGRLCFGWITDKEFIGRPKYVMICMILIGIVFFLFPFSKDYWTLVASSCAYGLLLGCTMVIFPILLVDFLGIELHSVSYGCMCFMNGFASFGRPFLIGYFRDHVGSYSNMFYVLGVISIAASLLWLLENLFVKKRKFKPNV